jgi:transposase
MRDSPLDTHGDVIEQRAYGRVHLAHLDDRTHDARIGATHLDDARGEALEQLVPLRRHDAAHRVAHRGIVDGVLEGVALARGRDIDEQLDVDLERLGPELFFGKDTVCTQLAYPGDENAIHGSTLVTAGAA